MNMKLLETVIVYRLEGLTTDLMSIDVGLAGAVAPREGELVQVPSHIAQATGCPSLLVVLGVCHAYLYQDGGGFSDVGLTQCIVVACAPAPVRPGETPWSALKGHAR